MKNYLAVKIGEEFKSPFGQTKSLGDLASLIPQIGIVIAGIIVVLLLIFYGIKTIAGAGSNDPKSAAQGKQAMTMAITGFIIVVIAYWIIRIIELITGTSFLTIFPI
ncbi:MAG: hypothetical protein UV74_C0001G0093 [Candidatus Woesebacteria bacterium GW2011_GWB1_43_14]|uniref:Integral membrane protein n=1 Tax=Candidatus Woesebacteria bacterium GW2011_GWB1_43_14 TaxID=1618578 RepID=A0A0G1GJM8_9BACT|nr:MAG: hypothetical protein UV51_C0002G0082 [Candidatus Woesebacteria bacterium GW2011_GWC1_42_9]KKS98983.1 MAG: hypothetical protein UV74_C0001G0093 [Candidatus Woesebacteria bacterium GW2011_GWB1_43_14]